MEERGRHVPQVVVVIVERYLGGRVDCFAMAQRLTGAPTKKRWMNSVEKIWARGGWRRLYGLRRGFARAYAGIA